MDEFSRQALTEWEGRRSARRREVAVHAVLWAAVNLLLIVIWAVTGAGFPWFVFPLFGWLVGVVAHGAVVYVRRSPDDAVMARELRRQRADGPRKGLRGR
jgi:fatty acid desaturase